MDRYRDPYRDAHRILKVFIGFILMVTLATVLLQQSRVKATSPSPEPNNVPATGTVFGLLYISDGVTSDTVFGGIWWDPGTTVGVILIRDSAGEFIPAGEVTITYWVEPPL